MALIHGNELTLSFGGKPLFDNTSFKIEAGERVGLLGRNGEGKSTLLKLVAGELSLDSGVLARSSGLRVAMLEQGIPENQTGTVEDLIRSGFHDDAADHHVDRLCSQLELDGSQPCSELSGGESRRALLGRALASEPDLLLLDEPTNHLDLNSIQWLETFLKRFSGALLFVTHDRTFLQGVANRIVELDRGQLSSWECDYATYLERKEEALANEEREWGLFDKKLAQEEEWIRRGIKARRTRNEGRVRALKRLREERAQRRGRVGEVRMKIQEGERSGTEVFRAKDISFGYENKVLVRDFSTRIIRGDRIGLIGPNGSGKTTLIRILLGLLEPDSGSVKQGTSVEVAYFDQRREPLDDNLSVAENVSSSAYIHIGDERKHIMSYLQDFLFSSERAREAVRVLSGGERNRLLLARLFTRPANVLILDEPTNDLDTETLELLEARLLDFKGTVLVASHDRTFLDNLCTSTFVFEGRGKVKEYVGGYSDWQRVVAARNGEGDAKASAKNRKREEGSPALTSKEIRRDAKRGAPDKPKRLGFNEKREFQALPERIEGLETEVGELMEEMANPEFFKGDPGVIIKATERSKTLTEEIEAAYARWADLESLS